MVQRDRDVRFVAIADIAQPVADRGFGWALAFEVLLTGMQLSASCGSFGTHASKPPFPELFLIWLDQR
jgi:hypothetical protein